MNSIRPQKRSPARAQQMEHHWRSALKIEMHPLFKMWVTPEIQKKKRLKDSVQLCDLLDSSLPLQQCAYGEFGSVKNARVQ